MTGNDPRAFTANRAQQRSVALNRETAAAWEKLKPKERKRWIDQQVARLIKVADRAEAPARGRGGA